MKKKSTKKEADVSTKIDSLKRQIFEMKLSKSISGVYDRKKMQDLKKQVIALYSSGN